MPKKKKEKYEIDETYYLKVDNDINTEDVDKVTFWTNAWNKTKTVAQLSLRISKFGIRVAGVTIKMRGKVFSLARIVAKHVLKRAVGEDETVRHKDGNPLNNHPDNIEIIKKSKFMSWISKGAPEE